MRLNFAMVAVAVAVLGSGCGGKIAPAYTGNYVLVKQELSDESFKGALAPPEKLRVEHKVFHSAGQLTHYIHFKFEGAPEGEKWEFKTTLNDLMRDIDGNRIASLDYTQDGLQLDAIERDGWQGDDGCEVIYNHYFMLFMPAALQVPNPKLLADAYPTGHPGGISLKPGEAPVNEDAALKWEEAMSENGAKLVFKIRRSSQMRASNGCSDENITEISKHVRRGGELTLEYQSEDPAKAIDELQGAPRLAKPYDEDQPTYIKYVRDLFANFFNWR